MFQPTRPPVRWSSVENSRAVWYGAWWLVEKVTAKPRCSVHAANAGISSVGSMPGIWTAPRSAASRLAPYTS